MTINQQVAICMLMAAFVFSALHSSLAVRRDDSGGVFLWSLTAAIAAGAIVVMVV